VTLGEQSLSFDPDQVASPDSATSFGRRVIGPSPAARLFARFGFTATASIGIDDGEGATPLFDLNRPDVPATLVGKFDLVFNGGTLEHVLHLPNTLANVSCMLRENGVVLHVLPPKNWVDMACISSARV